MSIKLSTDDKKILKTLDRNSKWSDVKNIENINKEIEKLEIYDDFISSGCSKYLNKAGETGKLDIDEMFENCKQIEKARDKVNKKTKKAGKARAGRRGRGGGNIGKLLNQTPVEVVSKQTKNSPIVNKAIEVKESLKGIISKSLSGDGWKGEILKLGLSLSMDTLFGIVLAVMELSETNPLGAFIISSTAMGLIYEIYNFISETETGKKLLGKGTDLLNELYNYLIGNDINVIKKKKKKPSSTDGGSKKDDDDDDDDDDDSGGDSFILDKDELNKYDTKEEPQEETKKEETKQETLQPSTPEPTNMMGFNALIPFLHAQQAQNNQHLRNENDNRLLQTYLNNPTQIKTDTPPTPEPQNNQPTDQQNTQPDSSLFSTAGLGVLGGLYSGFNYLSNNIMNAGNPANYNQVPSGQPLSGDAGSGVGGTGQEVFNTFSNDPSLTIPAPSTEPTNIVNTNIPKQEGLTPQQETDMEEGKDMIEKQQEQLKKQAEAKDDLNRKVQEQIDNMDNLGKAKALGLFAPDYGKFGLSTPPPILKLRGPTLKLKSIEESNEEFELLNEVEARAEETRLKAMENLNQQEDRKMTPEEYNEYIKREQIKIQEQREKDEEKKIDEKKKDVDIDILYEEQFKEYQEMMFDSIKERVREMSLQNSQTLPPLRDEILTNVRERTRANQRGEILPELRDNILTDVRERTRVNERGQILPELRDNILSDIRERASSETLKQLSSIGGDVLLGIRERTRANQRGEILPELRDDILTDVRERIRADERGEILPELSRDIILNVRERDRAIRESIRDKTRTLEYLRYDILSNVRQRDREKKEMEEARKKAIEEAKQKKIEQARQKAMIEEVRKKEQEEERKQALRNMDILDRAVIQLPDSVLGLVNRRIEQQNREANARAEELPSLQQNLLANVRKRVFKSYKDMAFADQTLKSGRGKKPSLNRLTLIGYLKNKVIETDDEATARRLIVQGKKGNKYNVRFTDFQGQGMRNFPVNIRPSIINELENIRRRQRAPGGRGANSELNDEEIQSIIDVILLGLQEANADLLIQRLGTIESEGKKKIAEGKKKVAE